jgi:LPXTG-site transpeptidase (sortase) family protein
VIAGHLDSYRGPAVFYRLRDLKRGDTIFVDRADGTEAVFATDRIERHDKDDFPTGAVYGDTPDSQLRLITCGGKFDKRHRRYLDHVIVYATRVG